MLHSSRYKVRNGNHICKINLVSQNYDSKEQIDSRKCGTQILSKSSFSSYYRSFRASVNLLIIVKQIGSFFVLEEANKLCFLGSIMRKENCYKLIPTQTKISTGYPLDDPISTECPGYLYKISTGYSLDILAGYS